MILNGSVEVTYPDGRTEILCMGNSFGVSPTMEKEYMKGVMKTKVDDCQVGTSVSPSPLLWTDKFVLSPFPLHVGVKTWQESCHLRL